MTALTIAAIAANSLSCAWQVIHGYLKLGHRWIVWVSVGIATVLWAVAGAVAADWGHLMLAVFVTGVLATLITISVIAAATGQRWRTVIRRYMNGNQ